MLHYYSSPGTVCSILRLLGLAEELLKLRKGSKTFQVRVIRLAEQTGRWYLLVHGRENAGNGAAVELSSELLDFAVLEFSSGGGGNVGRTTVIITGVVPPGGTGMLEKDLWFATDIDDLSPPILNFELNTSVHAQRSRAQG